MKKFEVGDRVKCEFPYDDGAFDGLKGTVVKKNNTLITVEFDNNIKRSFYEGYFVKLKPKKNSIENRIKILEEKVEELKDRVYWLEQAVGSRE